MICIILLLACHYLLTDEMSCCVNLTIKIVPLICLFFGLFDNNSCNMDLDD